MPLNAKWRRCDRELPCHHEAIGRRDANECERRRRVLSDGEWNESDGECEQSGAPAERWPKAQPNAKVGAQAGPLYLLLHFGGRLVGYRTS